MTLYAALVCASQACAHAAVPVATVPAPDIRQLERINSVNWTAVDNAMGRPGATQAGDVHRYNFPRGDMTVTVGGVVIKPAFVLGGWVAMKAMSGGVVAMGDLVLSESELTPVIRQLQAGGIEQTSIHHHLLRESPRVYYVHGHGHGDPVAVASAVKSAIDLTTAPPAAAATAAVGEIGIDTAAIAKAIGAGGQVNGGVYQISVPRAEVIRDGDFVIPPSMGLGTAINFQPTGNGNAAITGDFVMVASEVNAVIRALNKGGVEITALHNHMLTETPRLFFMHFWANADALQLAHTLREALDQTNSRR